MSVCVCVTTSVCSEMEYSVVVSMSFSVDVSVTTSVWCETEYSVVVSMSFSVEVAVTVALTVIVDAGSVCIIVMVVFSPGQCFPHTVDVTVQVSVTVFVEQYLSPQLPPPPLKAADTVSSAADTLSVETVSAVKVSSEVTGESSEDVSVGVVPFWNGALCADTGSCIARATRATSTFLIPISHSALN